MRLVNTSVNTAKPVATRIDSTIGTYDESIVGGPARAATPRKALGFITCDLRGVKKAAEPGNLTASYRFDSVLCSTPALDALSKRGLYAAHAPQRPTRRLHARGHRHALGARRAPRTVAAARDVRQRGRRQGRAGRRPGCRRFRRARGQRRTRSA